MFKPFAPHVADNYKTGHGPLFPVDTQLIYGNLTARSDRLFQKSPSCSMFWDSKVVWFGIQGVLMELKELWQESFFDKPKEQVLRRFKRRMDTLVGEGRVDIEALGRLHDLGYMPISVLALEEGSRVNMNVPLYVIHNTLPDFYWFVNYLETSLSTLIWKMVTNATIAYEYRRVLEHWAGLTGSPREFIDVQGHDFCYRGFGLEDGARAGTGHLLSFAGTDTIPAIDYAEDYYGANAEVEFLATSVTATEHAVATANILSNLHKVIEQRRADGLPDFTKEEFQTARLVAEMAFIKRAILEKCPTGVIALVCDSFNFWGVLGRVLPMLKAEIMSRGQDANGLAKVVVRPDSGDPVEVICGVEVLDIEGRNAAMDKRQRLVYWKEDGSIFKGKFVLDKGYSKTWADLDILVADIPGITIAQFRQWEVDSAALRNAFSWGFPSSFKSDEQEHLIPIAEQCREFLARHGIEVATWEVGQYMRGYQISTVVLSEEEKGAVETLWDIFGGTTNEAGYRTLDSHIGLIYGDSITVQRTQEIMRRLAKKGFAADNVVLGIGSYTYQYNTRDSFGMAIKATACQVDGQLIDLYKDPATEGETAKKSAKGFLAVEKVGDNFVLHQERHIALEDLATQSGELKPLFRDGEFLRTTTVGEIRQRLRG